MDKTLERFVSRGDLRISCWVVHYGKVVNYTFDHETIWQKDQKEFDKAYQPY